MIGERPPESTSRPRERKSAAASKTRSARKSRRTRRLERRAQKRKQRARAHLDRAVRQRKTAAIAKHPRHPRALPEVVGRGIFAGIFAAGLCVGLLWAMPIWLYSAQWWSAEPVLVQSVAVQGNLRLSASEVGQKIQFARGQRADRIDTRALESVLEENPWIAGARVALLPNGSLIVRIEERRPVATLQDGNDGEVFLVDASGEVFAPAEGEITEGLFRLQRRNAPVGLSQTADPLLARGAQLAEDIANRGLGELLGRGELLGLGGASLQLPDPTRPEGWILRSASAGLMVVLGDEDDHEIAARLDRLEELLQADLWAGPPTGRIDLRFEARAILHASVDL